MNRVTAMIYRLCLEAPPGKVRFARVCMPNGDSPSGLSRGSWCDLPTPQTEVVNLGGSNWPDDDHLASRRNKWGDWYCGAWAHTFDLWWSRGLERCAYDHVWEDTWNPRPVVRVLEADVNNVAAFVYQLVFDPKAVTVVSELAFAQADLIMGPALWHDHIPLSGIRSTVPCPPPQEPEPAEFPDKLWERLRDLTSTWPSVWDDAPLPGAPWPLPGRAAAGDYLDLTSSPKLKWYDAALWAQADPGWFVSPLDTG